MQERKHVILCVDDDPDVLVSLKVVLEAGGFGVVTAGDAREGMAAFRDTKPDVVILDLMMEDVDAGTRLLKEIRSLDTQTPIYMLSSTGDCLYNQADVNQLGLNGVFQKPVNPSSLLTLLRAKLKIQ